MGGRQRGRLTLLFLALAPQIPNHAKKAEETGMPGGQVLNYYSMIFLLEIRSSGAPRSIRVEPLDLDSYCIYIEIHPAHGNAYR